MEIVTIHAAKTTLSQLLARVEAGEEILLARGKQPIAKLVPFVPPARTRKFGALKGTVTVPSRGECARFFPGIRYSPQQILTWASVAKKPPAA